MKRRIVFLYLLFFISSFTIYANEEDSIRIERLEQSLQKEIRLRESLKAELLKQKEIINAQEKTINSLGEEVERNRLNIQSAADQLGLQISETNTILNTKAGQSDVNKKSIWGAILLFLFVILGGIVTFLLRKLINKSSVDVNDLKAKAEKLNEDILNKFSLEMSEMQKISASLAALKKANGQSGLGGSSSEPDHSLIKTLADRITFMEMTLFKMDPKVRGYKQLSKSISQMKDNLLANGYELVDMLGKPYNDGMKVSATFIEDGDLEQGKQIITGIIKPQINYNGIMIQSAQITVSQNI